MHTFCVKLSYKKVIFMQKLEQDATNEQIIAKINEIIEHLEAQAPVGGVEMAPNVKAYFDELGGMMR